MREDKSAEFDMLDMRQKAVAMCDHCINPTERRLSDATWKCFMEKLIR